LIMKLQKNVKRLLKEKDGFTLVELLVSFTLLLILMTAAFAVISPSAKVFMKSIGAGRAQSVSGIVMDRIVNELENAEEIITVDRDKVEYIDSNGNLVYMEKKMVDRGDVGKTEYTTLALSYYLADDSFKEWMYPKKMYMGNTIEELEFSKVEDKEDLVQVKLKLKNSQTGYEYERTRIVKCSGLEE